MIFAKLEDDSCYTGRFFEGGDVFKVQNLFVTQTIDEFDGFHNSIVYLIDEEFSICYNRSKNI